VILVDSSVWIDHFRHGDSRLQALLESGQALTHPFVIGELALGNIRQRPTILGLLQGLPQVIQAGEEEVLGFIERHALGGTGIGYIDVHLLASARLTSVPLWTRDKHLHVAAVKLRLAG